MSTKTQSMPKIGVLLGLSELLLQREKCLNDKALSSFQGAIAIGEKESADALKGTALDIYRLLLKTNKPLGIREIQRILKLSSPSIAQHHLARLEAACLVKREWGDYVINRVALENCVKISRFLIPRHLFYLLLAGCGFSAGALNHSIRI